MMKQVAIVILGLFVIGFLFYSWAAFPGPATPLRVAKFILLGEDDYPCDSLSENDAVITSLYHVSDDLQKLSTSPIVRLHVAKLLGRYETALSHNVRSDLLSRNDKSLKLLGLASNSLLYGQTAEQLEYASSFLATQNTGDFLLSIMCFAHSNQKNALPILRRALVDNRITANNLLPDICNTLALYNDLESVPNLRKRCTDEVSPDSFSALISLGQKDAMPLAINHLTGTDSRFDARNAPRRRLLGLLVALSGKDFGYETSKWQNWWSENRATWNIPPKFLSPKN